MQAEIGESDKLEEMYITGKVAVVVGGKSFYISRETISSERKLPRDKALRGMLGKFSSRKVK